MAIASLHEPSELADLADHHPIGISTGVFEQERGSWQALIERAYQVSTYAVELSALSEPELPGLLTYLTSKPRLPFRYVSVHAPVKARSLDSKESSRQLGNTPLWVRSIVAHPDVIEDPGPYRSISTRLVIENMDDRKQVGRTADELHEIFEALPDAGFCFDIAHAHSVDPSMAVGIELLDRFRSRLRQVHLSSLVEGRHVPLSEADARRFAPLLARCRDVPWIVEAQRSSGEIP